MKSIRSRTVRGEDHFVDVLFVAVDVVWLIVVVVVIVDYQRISAESGIDAAAGFVVG